MFHTVTAGVLNKKLKNKEVVLIDVREVGEYETECIEGSYLIPLGEIAHSKLPSTKKPLVIQCRSGRRSAQACQKLLDENPNLELYNLEGGIEAWKAVGFAIKTGGRQVWPLDRQVLFTAGTLVFSGYLLGYYFNPNFYLLAGFMGLGMMIAGFTGFCGMARILSKMPWNK